MDDATKLRVGFSLSQLKSAFEDTVDEMDRLSERLRVLQEDIIWLESLIKNEKPIDTEGKLPNRL